MTTPSWSFSQPPPASRRASVALFVFGAVADDIPLSRSRFGIASADGLAACDVRLIERAADSRWFDGLRSGSLRAVAAKDLGPDLTALDAAVSVHAITTEVTAPTDLGYLQAAWGLARYLVARGAEIVLDAHAIQFLRGRDLPRPEAPLDVAREVRVVYETDSTRPDHAHALHTRGMKKFGAPDLVALCADDDAPLVSSAIAELAEAVARGAELGTPRHRVDVMPGVSWVIVPDEHGLGELLQLNNAARVIVDAQGHDLVGVARRLRRAPS